jgi:hypothetical protein
VLLHTSTPHKGKVSLGIEVNILPAAVEHVRARGGLVIAQLNPDMPYTLGDGELDEDLIDLAIEAQQDLPTTAISTSHDHAQTIAEHVADLVGDSATCGSVSARSPTRRYARLPADTTWRSGQR